MSYVQILGLVAAVACLVTYLVAPGRPFDWVNATLWPVVAAASFSAHAWGPLLLNLGFGLAGAWHLWAGRAEHHTIVENRRRVLVREQANKVLLDAADGEVLYYREWYQ